MCEALRDDAEASQKRSTIDLETYRPWDAVGPMIGAVIAVLVQGLFAERIYKVEQCHSACLNLKIH